MKSHNFDGLFVAFEGLDGSGSSTQVELLVKKLNTLGFSAYGTKEPTNNIIGGLIRGALTHEWKPSSECLQLLYTADRAHHLNREVIPLIKKGNIVVTDRYLFSTIAFGSIDLDKKWLVALNDNFIIPDITFFIKVSPKICLQRIEKSRSKFELFEEEKKLNKVFKVYNELAKEKYDIVIIDGERTIEDIEKEVFAHVDKLIDKRKSKFKRRS